MFYSRCRVQFREKPMKKFDEAHLLIRILMIELRHFCHNNSYKSICRSVAKMCNNMCSIHWDSIGPCPMMLGGVQNRNHMSDCQKMTDKKMKFGQKSFFGRIFDFLGKSVTENSNFAKILTFGQCLPEIRALKFDTDTGLSFIRYNIK